MNYKNGKVYEIVCNITGERYIGSTTQALSKRLAEHRSNFKRYHEFKKGDFYTSFEIICRGAYAIILREEVPCENKEQLIRAERRHIESGPCVNKIIPGQTRREHHAAHRDEHLAQMRDYYIANKERINTQQRDYRARKKEVAGQWREWIEELAQHREQGLLLF